MVSKDVIKEMATFMVENGIDEKEADEKTGKLAKGVDEKLKGQSDEVRDNVFKIKIKQYVSQMVNLESIEVCLLGVSEMKDKNGYLRRQAEFAYKDNPGKAVDEGYAQVDDNGNVTYLDFRETIDRAGKMENFNKGKPIRPRWEQTGVGVDNEGNVITIYGDLQKLSLHNVYQMFGKMKNNNFSLSDKVKPKLLKSADDFSRREIWDMYKHMGDDGHGIDGDDISEHNNEIVVIKGMVEFAGVTKYGTPMIVLSGFDDPEFNLYCFIEAEQGENVLSEVEELNQVLLLGRASAYERKDGSINKSLQVYGGAIDPVLFEAQGTLDDLDEILL